VAIHVANGFGHMVIVVTDGDLRRVAAATLVYSLELSGSFSGLREAATLGQLGSIHGAGARGEGVQAETQGANR
jgi:hypothetical protein